MAMVRKKQDDKYLEALRELITTGGGNRQCFDCGQKGPTYVNMTIGSFVCTRCSGVLRGITPPHRVKSISMATFTQDEIDFLKAHGNDVCAKTWLGLWDPKRAVHQDQRELMIDKYERKRYYLEPASPLKSLTNATNLKTTAAATTASTSSSSTSANNNQINNNNRSSTNNNNNNNTQIQLTPPTSQRTTANGLHKTSSSAISRPQHSTVQAQNGFASSQHNTDAFGLHNGLNSSVGSMSTGALSDTSSCASANGFGAEADFVADFGSADIFNATVASSPASSVASSTTTNNGYAKIQPIKTAQQQFMNGYGGSNNTNLKNGNLSNGNTENFADFDHAPIYNAAAVIEEPPNYQFVRKNAIRKKSNASVSGSIIRRNERQLKDILEMDNNENVEDYINFEEDDVFGESKSTKTASCNSKTPGYSNLFDDFDTLLTLDDDIRQQQQQHQRRVNSKGYESDYVNIGGDNSVNTTKFTPLALAAHATAMAVLGNQSHFNQQQQQQQLHVFENTTTKPLMLTANQWDVWSQSKSTSSPNTAWFSYEQTQQQQQQQHQLQQHLQNPYTNINAGNLLTQQPQYQQHFASNSTFALSSATHPSSATIFDTGKTTTLLTTSAACSSSALTIGTTMTTTSMFNQNSTINTTTNPFRMHLDVNDNDNHNNHHNRNIINYNYNNNRNGYNYFQITTTTSTPTPTPTTTTTINSFDYNQNFNNSNSNFDFVANSILSYNFQQSNPKTATTTTTTAASSSSVNPLTTMSTSLPPIHNYAIIDNNNNNCDNNYSNMSLENSNTNFNSNSNSKNSTTNPFLTTLDNSKLPSSALNDPYTIMTTTTTTIATSSPFTTPSVNTIATSSLDFYSNKSPENPFNSTSLQIQPPIASQQDHHLHHHYPSFHQNVVDINANNIQMSSNNNMLNSVVDQNQVVAPHTDIDKNSNLNSNSNSYQNDNQNPNQNLNNKSWRLPINNNNKNSTTNGFNNNINNNNNNNINHNSSAPAEDRYAALKDLDEQLRESKAVAAQAASIVTANVVDSGFGNPNVNGTVNPFATHQHHHQQTAVVNPFQQNASNNPTQNTTQQLFGQMTLIPNGIATANGFLNAQKTHTANTGFFNYTASGFTNANIPPQLQQQQQQQQQQHQIQATVMYPTSIQTGPNGCGFGFGTLQQQIASTGTGLTTNTFNNPFAATGALNSNNPFL